ncbi:exonuclease domain-containing protein [Serratia marcescens]|uniref:exonuclease domain-containing protein n=1 Tax=Serratia marcescens TaxID=615 RepID=UPI00080A82C6
MTPQQQAQQWLDNNCLILDTETTGLGEDAEIVEITIINSHGAVLLNTLVKPTVAIPAEATAIHGITDEMVKDAPRWMDIHAEFCHLIAGNPVVTYNANYDTRLINQTAKLWGLEDQLFNLRKSITISCAMIAYAEHYGATDPRRGGFKWQKLTAAAEQQSVKIQGAEHRALSDCMTTLGVIKAMASGNRKATSTLSAQSAVDTLQQLFKADPTAITALVNNRVFCSEGFVRDTPATVGICDGVYLVGMIGIINALIAPEVIAAIYDDMELTGFTVANITAEGSTS